MKRLRFNHRQIHDLLMDEKRFLSKLLDDRSLSPAELDRLVHERIREIDGAFIKRRKVEEKVCAGDCHFVKNGTYKRGTSRIQNNICTVCRRLQPADRVRNGLDGYLKRRLVQLKLEGIPTKVISQLIGVTPPNVEYYWRELSRLSFHDLIHSKLVTNFRAAKYQLKLWSDFDGDIIPEERYGLSRYKIEIPIDQCRKLVVSRFPRHGEETEYRRVRLAHVLLMGNVLKGGGNFGNDQSMVERILKLKVKEFKRLTRVRDSEMTIEENTTSESKSENIIPFNIKFDYDHIQDFQMGHKTFHKSTIKSIRF